MTDPESIAELKSELSTWNVSEDVSDPQFNPETCKQLAGRWDRKKGSK